MCSHSMALLYVRTQFSNCGMIDCTFRFLRVILYLWFFRGICHDHVLFSSAQAQRFMRYPLDDCR